MSDKNANRLALKRLKHQSLTKIVAAMVSGAKSKRDIQAATGMAWGTCSEHINFLRRAGVVVPEEGVESTVQPGPKAISFKFVDDAHLVMGIEIAPTHISTSILNLGGQPIASSEYKLPEPPTSETIIDTIYEQFMDSLQTSRISEDSIECLTLSLTGALDRENLIWIKSPKFVSLNKVNFSSLYRCLPRLNMLKIEHDVIARATSVCHRYQIQSDSYAFLHVSDGLGLAVWNEGRFYVGSRGLAGEIGHIPFSSHTLLCGDKCFCGQEACVESRLSTKGLLRTARQISGRQIVSVNDLEQVLDAHQLNTLGEEFRKLLVHVTVILVNLFDPNMVIVGGEALSPWFESLQREFPDELRSRSWMSGPQDILWYEEQQSNTATGANMAVLPEVRHYVLKQLTADGTSLNRDASA